MKGIMFKDWKIKFIAEHPDMEIQHRWVIKPQPDCNCEGNNWRGQVIDWVGYKHEGKVGFFCYKCGAGLQAVDAWSSHGTLPRYQVGRTVYVKEAWAYADGGRVIYKAAESDLSHWEKIIIGQWRSPMSLKAVNARLFLVVQDIRPERVQEIKLADIFAEGCPAKRADYDTDPAEGYYRQNDAYEWFVHIWDSINPDYPWESNPFVWQYVLTARKA
jgi:hypothetical protein